MKNGLNRYTQWLTDGWLVGVIALVILGMVGLPPTWASAQGLEQMAFTSPLAPPDDGDHEAMDELLAKLAEIVDRDALLAEILGISEEELDAARAAGTRLDELAESLGLDAEEVRTALQSAIAAAIEQAVTDGVLTEEEAALLLNPPAHHGPGGPGGGRGPGGPGHGPGGDGAEGPGGTIPAPPSADGDESNTSDSATTTFNRAG